LNFHEAGRSPNPLASLFPTLFSPLRVGPVTLKNRIVFTAHHTNLADDAPSTALAAYYQARAAGGAGLIVVEIASVSERGGRYSSAS
jgi:2,4-dienoyl-CoA reductase (NADPH2)